MFKDVILLKLRLERIVMFKLSHILAVLQIRCLIWQEDLRRTSPEEIKPAVRYSGKNELVWSDLGSSYSLATVGGKEVRGSKVDLLHCSEVAFWGDGG